MDFIEAIRKIDELTSNGIHDADVVLREPLDEATNSYQKGRKSAFIEIQSGLRVMLTMLEGTDVPRPLSEATKS